MKIELKKLKVFESGSQETYCFTAELWVDGRYQGSVRNDGQGGSHIISPPSLEAQINEWGKTLPPRKIPGIDDPVHQDAESLINDIVSAYVAKKELQQLLRKNIIFTKTDAKGVYEVGPKAPDMILAFVQNQQQQREFRDYFKVDKILNLLPFDEALQVYMEKAG